MKNRFLILCLIASNVLYASNDPKDFHLHLNTQRKNAEAVATVVGSAAAVACFYRIMSKAPSIYKEETAAGKFKALAINGGYFLAAVPASCLAFAFGYAPTVIAFDPTILNEGNKTGKPDEQNDKMSNFYCNSKNTNQHPDR